MSYNLFDTQRGDIVFGAAQIAALLADAPPALAGTTLALSDNQTSAKTLSATDPATDRLIYGKLTVDYAGDVTIGGGSGFLAGVRGEIDVAAGTTAKDGFYYGAQGKVILAGTMDQTSATRLTGLLGQLDASAGTVTAGQLSAVWADMGATAPTGGWGTETNVVRASNTTADAVNALFYGYGKATYGFDLSDNGGGWVIATGTASTPAGGLKVNINGQVRYIQTYSGAPA